jgi:2-polyprenyl-3-methyl-5-hydroxy-6-metoxy-1,4-benzoquinol methylase
MNIEPKAKLYREEANFFFELIKKKIHKNSNILDVGAGPGFLVEKLILEGYPNTKGIDKISKGFSENYLIQKKIFKKSKKK